VAQLIPADMAISEMCLTQTWLVQFSELAYLFWCSLICFTLHCVLGNLPCGAVISDPEKFEIRYHLLVWPISGIVASSYTVLVHSETMSTGGAGWCRLAMFSNTVENFFRGLVSFIWVFCMIYVVIVLRKVRTQITFMENDVEKAQSETVVDTELVQNLKKHILSLKRLRLYPFTMILCFFFGLVHHSLTLANAATFWSGYAHILTSTLQGFASGVVFIFTPSVYETLRNSCFPNGTREMRSGTGGIDKNQEAGLKDHLITGSSGQLNMTQQKATLSIISNQPQPAK
jgi:hypothetical protein